MLISMPKQGEDCPVHHAGHTPAVDIQGDAGRRTAPGKGKDVGGVKHPAL